MIPLYSCQLDPLTLPIVRDPEIVPAVGALYRSRKFPDRLVRVTGYWSGFVEVHRSRALKKLEMLSEDFFDQFIHTSVREDAS